MPDFEIRYFNADGTLAFVIVTSQPSEAHAEEHAARNNGNHARFEIHSVGAGSAT